MGGGSGGRSVFYSKSPKELQQEIRAAELESAEAEFQPLLSKRLSELLTRVNDRDRDLTDKRLDDVKEILNLELESTVRLKYGGSVAKHTFVDGLSDVDMLLVLKSDLHDENPNALLENLAKHLTDGLTGDVKVSRGRIAITLTYGNSDEIQLIPAVHKTGKLHVPSWSGDEWSAIDPDGFGRALTKQNERCAMKLVPTIKLAKAINVTLPEQQRLSGYHIESMGIEAFKSYEGTYVVEKMLPHFIGRMVELVKKPIRDSSGQSVHVDEYLGRANSDKRRQMAHVLDRISKRMENATASRSIDQWNSLLGE